MFPAVSRLNLLSLPLLVAAVVGCGQVSAQTDEAIELREAQTALQVSAVRMTDLEAAAAKANEQVKTLTESLAASNAEVLEAREGYEKLRIQMEGLGMAALDSSQSEVQQRLLVALSDLRILEEQKRVLAEALITLSESSLALAQMSGGVDEESKKNLDNSLAGAEKALAKLQGANNEAASDLQGARVVSLKDELGIAVFNVGSKHGVHPGMPFSIYRQDKPIARALVVDVRNAICGAVVQELVSKEEPVKVGDAGKVESIKG